MEAVKDTDPGQPRNAWLNTQGMEALNARWLPYLHGGDGYKAAGYRRDDGRGYVLPVVGDDAQAGFHLTSRWWATWAHPNLCGRPGWHHLAFGDYSSAQAAALAFDTVYAMEKALGNKDRCPE